MWEKTGIKPKELDELLELPLVCFAAWEAFAKLNQRRTSNGFGINPITYNDINTYCNLYQITLEPWEIDLICAFDNEVLIVHNKQAEKAKAQNSSKPRKR